MRKRGFDAGQLMEGQLSKPSAAAIETVPLDLDPSLEGKVVELFKIKVGSSEPDPVVRKRALIDMIAKLEKIDPDFRINNRLFDVINHENFVINPPETLRLVHLSVGDLGFTEQVPSEQVYERAEQLGLARVRPDVAVALRAEYKTQPVGQYLYLAMDPIHTGTEGAMFRLLTTQNGSQHLRWLDVIWPRSDEWFAPDDRFVFAAPL